MNSLQPVLQVSDLTTRFNTEDGTVHAVNGVSFDLADGEVVGIVSNIELLILSVVRTGSRLKVLE